ncbi:hypothetical protein AVEN_184489-1 [Araneus ventricosus]|uniref:Integrase catalytic domain-containing protein n=1 Tax=Araneus ventricosus TaxID=182803 RepID=A0A4Y2BHU1_ARAVE|nr:hypothetical protein AVEN_184489-1 [Araneus ventricosus]
MLKNGIENATLAEPEKDLKQGLKVACSAIMWAHHSKERLWISFSSNNKRQSICPSINGHFTKWAEAIPISDQEASTVPEQLVRSWISCYGVPMILHLDQGTNFNSALFTELCKLLGILKTRTTTLHPESDGMVERFNRMILNHVFICFEESDRLEYTFAPLSLGL